MITISKAMAWFLFSGWVIVAAVVLWILVRKIREIIMDILKEDWRDKDVS